MTLVKINLNNSIFQNDLFNLEKSEQTVLIKMLKKIHRLTWSQLYVDFSLKWEVISSKYTKSGERLDTFRFFQKYRVLALRQDDFLRLLLLHTDMCG